MIHHNDRQLLDVLLLSMYPKAGTLTMVTLAFPLLIYVGLNAETKKQTWPQWTSIRTLASFVEIITDGLRTDAMWNWISQERDWVIIAYKYTKQIPRVNHIFPYIPITVGRDSSPIFSALCQGTVEASCTLASWTSLTHLGTTEALLHPDVEPHDPRLHSRKQLCYLGCSVLSIGTETWFKFSKLVPRKS